MSKCLSSVESHQSMTCFPGKTSFRNEGELKIFSEKGDWNLSPEDKPLIVKRSSLKERKV